MRLLSNSKSRMTLCGSAVQPHRGHFSGSGQGGLATASSGSCMPGHGHSNGRAGRHLACSSSLAFRPDCSCAP